MSLNQFPPQAPETALAVDDAAGRLTVLQAGLDRVNQGFTIIDAELRLVAWNRAFFTMLDFPEELARIGTPFEAFMRYNAERGDYGPGDVEALVAERVAAARALTPHYMERVRPNGQVIAVRGEPVPGCGFVTIYTDVTEQRRIDRLIRGQNAELERRVRERTEALARSEERLRLITDTIPALIAAFDRDLVYRFANRGYADWFGRGKEEVVGRPIAEVLGADLHAELMPYVGQAMAGETVSYEYAVLRPDGQTAYARSILVPELEADGRVSGAFVLASDITEQKRAQAALLQGQKMEAVGQLAGGLAHDFNNMLTVVIGNLATLQERNVAGNQDFLEPALMAARHGVALIRRLLSFARQQPLEPQPVDIGALIHSLILLLRGSLPENIGLETRLRHQPLFALADPHQLESALLNLALNARDAMPDGGELCIAAERQTVAEAAARELEVAPGDYVRITVGDNGCGMDAATVARACEPFFTTKGYAAGSGLGLSMAYGFIRQSGGALRLDSAPGQGTRVGLWLPGTAAALPALEEGARPPLATAAGQLVLLVEDDPEVRKVLRLQLTELGYPVIEAEDGAEALRILEAGADVGILVSDMVMPGGIDGKTLATRVRASRPGIGVLLVSGYAGERADTGPDLPLLAKPFGRRELAAALRAVVNS